MAITGIHHTGLTVRDHGRSIYFLPGPTGTQFRRTAQPLVRWSQAGIGDPDRPGPTCGRSATSRRGHRRAPRVPHQAQEPVPQNRTGASHIALYVDELAAKKRELEDAGVTFLSDINVVDDGVNAGWRWLYLLDPDGIPVELIEVAYAPDPVEAHGTRSTRTLLTARVSRRSRAVAQSEADL